MSSARTWWWPSRDTEARLQELEQNSDRNGGTAVPNGKRVQFRNEPYPSRGGTGSDSEGEATASKTRVRKRLQSGKIQIPLFDWRHVRGTPTSPAETPHPKPRPNQFGTRAELPGYYIVYAPENINIEAMGTERVDLKVQVKLPAFSTLAVKQFRYPSFRSVDPQNPATPAPLQLGSPSLPNVECVPFTVQVLNNEWMDLCVTLRNNHRLGIIIDEGEPIARVTVRTVHQPVENPPTAAWPSDPQ